MCRTSSIDYMLCMHTRVDHRPCSRSRSIFARFLAACKDDISKININDFCVECRKFWDHEEISETTRRELAHNFRIMNSYHGPMTPVTGEGGAISFRLDGEPGQPESASGGLVTAPGMDDDVKGVSMMNARFHWLAIGDEPELPEEKPQEQEQPQSPLSRRGSDASALTIWPSGFDEITVVERDEFGNEINLHGMAALAAAHLASHGLVHPDEFEMKNLDEPLPSPVDADGFEFQRMLRPAAPIASALPHRLSGELVKPDRSYAVPSRLSATF